MSKIYKFILIIFSFFNLLIVKFRKIHCANYFIITNSSKPYDQRSSYFFDLTTCYYSLNLLRVNQINFKTFLKILKIPNFFCYSILKNLSVKLTNLNNFKLFLLYLFKLIKINKLLLIDDYREMKLFSFISKKLKINSLIYMHGRFSKNTKALKKIRFSKYLVWSEFFSNQLQIANTFYNNDNVVIVGSPYLKKMNYDKIKSQKFLIKNCLILEEDFTNFFAIKKYYKSLVDLKNINIFIKKKLTKDLSEDIISFCKLNKIRIIKKEIPIQNIIKKFKINCIIATTSTGLLESSYFQIAPIKIDSKNNHRENEFDEFVKKKFVFYAKNPTNLQKIMSQEFYYKDLLDIKNKLWGDKIFNSKIIKKKIKKFIIN